MAYIRCFLKSNLAGLSCRRQTLKGDFIVSRTVTLWFVTAILIGSFSTTCVAETSEQARKIAEENNEAVVTVQLVVETSMSFGGETEKEENRISVPGTVIDPSGLVVSALSELDPTKVFSTFMEGETDSKFSSNVVDVKIKSADGTEIPADIVLRDRDLDLAFLRPKKAPASPMKFVDLSKSATPQLADELCVLYRLGPAASRSLAVLLQRVQAVVTKPRTFYVINGERFGCPAFALDGKPVGIVVMRTAPGDGRSTGMFSSNQDMLMVVLPCSTVLKAAQQAKEASPEKPAEKPATKPAPTETPKKN